MRTRTARTVAALSGLTLLLAACGDDDNGMLDDDGQDAPAEETEETEEGEDDGDYAVEDQPDDAAATFVSPQDGDTVEGSFTVELAAEGVELAPADAPAVGEAHLHVIVDEGCFDEGEIIPGPSDETTEEGYIHFGDGSEGGEIELEPGDYELCVQLADGVHTAFGDTETIDITGE